MGIGRNQFRVILNGESRQVRIGGEVASSTGVFQKSEEYGRKRFAGYQDLNLGRVQPCADEPNRFRWIHRVLNDAPLRHDPDEACQGITYNGDP